MSGSIQFAEGFLWGAAVSLWVRERYGDTPLYITENGAAFYDPPAVEEEMLEDPLRVEYLEKHMRQARQPVRRLGLN